MKIQPWLFKILRKQSVTDGRTDGRTDNVKTVYPPQTPPQTKFAGGIITISHPPLRRLGGGGGIKAIWAVTCGLQQCGILTSVDSDEPVQPPFKLRNYKLCSVSSLTLIEYSSEEQRLWSDWAYAQAGLSLCWSHIPHCWKSFVAAHMSTTPSKGGHINYFSVIIMIVC